MNYRINNQQLRRGFVKLLRIFEFPCARIPIRTVFVCDVFSEMLSDCARLVISVFLTLKHFVKILDILKNSLPGLFPLMVGAFNSALMRGQP